MVCGTNDKIIFTTMLNLPSSAGTVKNKRKFEIHLIKMGNNKLCSKNLLYALEANIIRDLGSFNKPGVEIFCKIKSDLPTFAPNLVSG